VIPEGVDGGIDAPESTLEQGTHTSELGSSAGGVLLETRHHYSLDCITVGTMTGIIRQTAMCLFDASFIACLLCTKGV
jgi:hypothetical protein